MQYFARNTADGVFVCLFRYYLTQKHSSQVYKGLADDGAPYINKPVKGMVIKMAKSSFVHVGITVKDMKKTIAFYEKYFGFTVGREMQFPAGFFDAKPTLYNLYPGAISKMAMITSPDGVTMELFEFDKQEPATPAIWNTPGYHHICLKVDDCVAKCKEMEADGVELFFQPDHMGPPERGAYWVFLKDPDGNMIELQSGT